jgi:hypothetical protein
MLWSPGRCTDDDHLVVSDERNEGAGSVDVTVVVDHDHRQTFTGENALTSSRLSTVCETARPATRDIGCVRVRDHLVKGDPVHVRRRGDPKFDGVSAGKQLNGPEVGERCCRRRGSPGNACGIRLYENVPAYIVWPSSLATVKVPVVTSVQRIDLMRSIRRCEKLVLLST